MNTDPLHAPMGEILILHNTDGMITPGLVHGTYVSVGVASDVVLQDKDRVYRTICANNMTACKEQRFQCYKSFTSSMIFYNLPKNNTLLAILAAFRPSIRPLEIFFS